MRRKLMILLAGIGLVLSLFFPLGAEVALDEVVQAGRFIFYRDHADQHKYYYVPDQPRLATRRDGTPEFTFIKYTKTDGATKGGVAHFLVTWGYTSGELNSAESALKMTDPQAKVAGPVPFKEGTFRIISATAGEGGLFNRRIVGEGKAPVLPGQKAAVSIALTEEGASFLWESFKNPTSDVSVQFMLKFAGLTPAFQAKLKVDWDKVYSQHDIKLAAEGTIKVVKIKADVRATLEELRQKGAIELDVVGENQNMQKMLDTAYEHILSLMCDKVPTGAGGTVAPSPSGKIASAIQGGRAVRGFWPGDKFALDGDWPAIHPAWSMAAVAGVVGASEKPLRGGPFIDQEQVQARREPGVPCDPDNRQKAESLARRALALLQENKYQESNSFYQQAFDVCPDPKYLYEIALTLAFSLYSPEEATRHFQDFLERTAELSGYEKQRADAQAYVNDSDQTQRRILNGDTSFSEGRYAESLEAYRWLYDHIPTPTWMFNMGICYKAIGDETGNNEEYEKALRCLEACISIGESNAERYRKDIDNARVGIEMLREIIGAATPQARAAEQQQAEVSTEDARRQRRQEAQQAQAGQVQTATGAQSGGTKPPDTTGGGTKPPTRQTQAADVTAGQTQQVLSSLGGTKPPDTAGGTKPPTGQAQQGITAGETTPPTGTAGQAAAPEVKPIVSVEIGYSYKRIKLSGKYEVDMRNRLREDRDIVMTGNISGVYQKYGEDKRFFTVVSLDDPTFQERTIEVILDGQDAEDFKNYINSVSVLFKKQRFAGPMLTGEVRFFEQQFAERGNRLSFKYGRVNEASTEWLDYEYKTKWNFYGGIEWESDWTRTSDSVLTLSPPVKRRAIEISVDEDNILRNGVKAVAFQIKHNIFGKDILKEVVINYDKGDPLHANYTYLHEEGRTGYAYKAIWLTLDGKEVATDWIKRESPFVYAVFTE